MAFSHDGLVYSPGSESNLKIGEYQVELTVLFSTTKYHLQDCANGAYPDGFHVARREDTKKLVFYCGANMKPGDTFTIIVEQGI